MSGPLLSANLGFPRIGAHRELKRALESYWSGSIDHGELLAVASELRNMHWLAQHRAGIDHVPSNDFSLYDHVLDTAVMLGATSGIEVVRNGSVDLDAYFALARGGGVGDLDVEPLRMTKWFDTNYHYLVPEALETQEFAAKPAKLLSEYGQALELGIRTRPVILGPATFVYLSRVRSPSIFKALVSRLTVVYSDVLDQLASAGADWVQIDEPILGLDLDEEVLDTVRGSYAELRSAQLPLKVLVATYFAGLSHNLSAATSLAVDGLHADIVSDPGQLDALLELAPEHLVLSLGCVDGRNIWRSDLDGVCELVRRACHRVGSERVIVAPSCSLLHLPYDVDSEMTLDEELKSWLSFAMQRLTEVRTIARAVGEGTGVVERELEAARRARAARRSSSRTSIAAVRERLAEVAANPLLSRRSIPLDDRRKAQREHLGLPLLPTTTIGSLPQTGEIRSLRTKLRRGDIDEASYDEFVRSLIGEAVAFQESIDLDVLVHGEFERTDMVEYFAEHLTGYATTSEAWVQSYGSRCIRPPILYGDITRPAPISLRWFEFAQSLTNRPVKGMLTGPVTMAEWSYVRDDLTKVEVCRQLALAIRDEVGELESVGAAVIQIDEPALREGLPLRASERPAYLAWAAEAFRLASSGVSHLTQIHTHMCYADFGDIIEGVAALDADVISIEAARSHMVLLDDFAAERYPGDVGPGVWDVHAPRIPSRIELIDLIRKGAAALGTERMWVNPDCGLKTRRWEEVRTSLRHIVESTKVVRAEIGDG